MIRVARLVFGVLLLCWSGASTAGAQEAEVLDRVVAVVGNRPILSSQIDEQLLVRFPNGQGLPTDPKDLQSVRKGILDELISDELLLQQAKQDTTVKVTDEDVNAAVEASVKSVRGRYPSDDDFRRDLQAAGFQTLEEWRSWLFEQQHAALLRNELTDHLKATNKLKTVVPTEAEMRAWFSNNKGEQKRPATATLRQIVIAPKPTAAAKQRAFALADSIAKEIRAGADFAIAARRFSADSASREQGGDLNWFRRGIMDPAFERVAFSYKPGIVSDPVETAYGYHIIQVQRVQPAEVQARHILIMPDIGQAEADSAKALAEMVHAKLLAGASFDSLQRLYHDAPEAREIQRIPVDKLPPSYTTALEGVEEGQITPVFMLPAPDPNRSKYGIVRVDGREPAGDLRYEDVKDEVRRKLTEIMTLQRYLERLRSSTFVETRDP